MLILAWNVEYDQTDVKSFIRKNSELELPLLGRAAAQPFLRLVVLRAAGR